MDKVVLLIPLSYISQQRNVLGLSLFC